MRFKVYFKDILSISIVADNEKDAWKRLKKAGIGNRSKLLKVVEQHDEIVKNKF